MTVAGKNSGLTAVIGPTASGKSTLAMALAEQVGGEILSADSMQVYRGMDIGTAKPTADEQARVRHHLIDVVEPIEPFTVAMFVEQAERVIEDARARRVPLIVAGGTPLYYKALFEGLFAGPGADAEVRDRLAAETSDAMHARLREIDPPAAERIHVNDRKRLVRAIEVFELTGRPISSLQSQWGQVEWGDQSQPRHAARWFGLSWPKDELNRRINARVKQMIDAGWVDETRTLLSKHGNLSKTAGEATGYAELIAHVRGELSLEDAIEQIKIATRQLARRQMKWLRRFPNVTWLEGDRPLDELAQAVVDSQAGQPLL